MNVHGYVRRICYKSMLQGGGGINNYYHGGVITVCVCGLREWVTGMGSKEDVTLCFRALALRSSRSTLPFSSELTTTTFMPL